MAYQGKNTPINVELLLDTFSFDLDQGRIFVKDMSRQIPERVNTKKDGRQYLTVTFDGRSYLKHRLLYAAAYRTDPGEDYIVHVNDKVPFDNRRWNLARMTPSELNRYHGAKVRKVVQPKSSVRGVHYHSTTARWRYARAGKQLFSSRDKAAVEAFAFEYKKLINPVPRGETRVSGRVAA